MSLKDNKKVDIWFRDNQPDTVFLAAAKVGGRDCIISQTGFTGEKGYEI